MAKLTIKKVSEFDSKYDVSLDGVKVATLYFYRCSPTRKHNAYSVGSLTGHVSGKRIDLSGYGYFKDVKRDMLSLLEEVR